MMSRRVMIGIAAAGLAAATGGFALREGRRRRDLGAARTLLELPVAAPEGPLKVFHLGHSLVGRDMPAMLAQLAPQGHDHASQLGWGTPLRAHWEPDVAINGFDTENDHPKFSEARAALEGGAFDALVLTEMVELKDAIRYHGSAAYLADWVALAHAARPDMRIYLYETWHNTDDPAGWLARIDTDYDALWLDRLLLPAVAQTGVPVHVIPAGQVLAAFVRAVEAQGGVGNIAGRDALMARTPEGAVDTIHLSDLGAYLVALTHFATLYKRTPVGLPLALMRADGTAADAPDTAAGLLMQQTVRDVVRRARYSGVGA